MDQQAYRIGRLTLRPRRELRDGGTRIPLGGRALDLLSELAERGGGLVTKDELFATVWNGAIVEENALQAQVSAVRKALGDEAARLVTVHGRGYCLRLEDAPAAGSAPPASIAVLPFANIGGDPRDDYLADGLAEELIATLSRVSGLKVPSRTSCFVYRDRVVDIRAIARDLGVATVLEGSVRSTSHRLRVTAQLIDAGTGFHLWAETFDRPVAGLLDLQEDLAGAITRALRREWQPARTATANPEAMRLVLQARAASRRVTAESLGHAVRLAREAIALDPRFAKAWESLAGTTFVMANVGMAPPSGFAEARELALKAIELEPELGGAYGILGAIEGSAGRFVEAMAGHGKGASLDPANTVLDENLALQVLLPTGLLALATERAEHSISLGPARPQAHLARAVCSLIRGEIAAACSHLETALLLGQERARPAVELILADDAFGRGAVDEAAALLGAMAVREFALPEAGAIVARYCGARATRIDLGGASEVLTALADAAHRGGSLWWHSGSAGLFVHWQAQLGQLDAAFDAASRIVAQWRASGLLATASLNPLWRPDMAVLRRDPRFQELIRALGLFRFWDRHGPPDGHAIVGGKLVEAAN